MLIKGKRRVATHIAQLVGSTNLQPANSCKRCGFIQFLSHGLIISSRKNPPFSWLIGIANRHRIPSGRGERTKVPSIQAAFGPTFFHPHHLVGVFFFTPPFSFFQHSYVYIRIPSDYWLLPKWGKVVKALLHFAFEASGFWFIIGLGFLPSWEVVLAWTAVWCVVVVFVTLSIARLFH